MTRMCQIGAMRLQSTITIIVALILTMDGMLERCATLETLGMVGTCVTLVTLVICATFAMLETCAILVVFRLPYRDIHINPQPTATLRIHTIPTIPIPILSLIHPRMIITRTVNRHPETTGSLCLRLYDTCPRTITRRDNRVIRRFTLRQDITIPSLGPDLIPPLRLSGLGGMRLWNSLDLVRIGV